MVEIGHWDRIVGLARVSMQDPIALAVLRLHYEEYGSCAECGMESNKGWPCPTVRAIEEVAAEPSPIPSEAIADAFQELFDKGFMGNVQAQVADLDTGAVLRRKPDEPVQPPPSADGSSVSDQATSDNPKETP